jgi:hypothetical protein
MLWWEAAGSVVSADVTSTAGASVMQSYRPAVQSHLGVLLLAKQCPCVCLMLAAAVMEVCGGRYDLNKLKSVLKCLSG